MQYLVPSPILARRSHLAYLSYYDRQAKLKAIVVEGISQSHIITPADNNTNALVWTYNTGPTYLTSNMYESGPMYGTLFRWPKCLPLFQISAALSTKVRIRGLR